MIYFVFRLNFSHSFFFFKMECEASGMCTDRDYFAQVQSYDPVNVQVPLSPSFPPLLSSSISHHLIILYPHNSMELVLLLVNMTPVQVLSVVTLVSGEQGEERREGKRGEQS